MAGPQVSRQKIEAAVQGDVPALREVLLQIAQTTDQQQAVTNTTPQAGAPTGQANPAAAVPPQAAGTISVLNNTYVVQIVNPGGTSAVSQKQAAQQAGSANALTALRPVRPIFHQIRASTSPAFNVNSNTQTFGGNTGQVQTYWTLSGLGTGTWYIQFRSSYDGTNWNKWKNANGGSAFGGLVNQVTLETVGASNWILFTLPGGLVMGMGAAGLHDRDIFELAPQVYSSGMLGIAGPNGYDANGNGVYGITHCDLDIQTPTVPTAGIPDYPVELSMDYGSSTGGGYLSAGSARIFAIAFDPTNDNVKLYSGPGGTVWAEFRLAGGAKIAIGQGKNSDGDTIWTPSLPWMTGANSMGIAVPTDATNTGPQPLTGINGCHLSGFTLFAKYQGDAGGTWGTSANWMCIAWQDGAPVETIGGHKWLTIALQGGHAVAIGAGSGTSGTPFTLPSGYTSGQVLGVAAPNGCAAVANHLRGVQSCSVFGTNPTLTYSDNTNFWSGAVSWLVAAWK